MFSRVNHNESLRDTSLLAAEAELDSLVVFAALKFATNRERPNQRHGDGQFWVGGGKSFPSGHATEVWTLSTVLSRRYPEKRWLPWVAYGLASAVSVLRLTSKEHHPSDVLFGSVIGFMVGNYVERKNRTSRFMPDGIAPTINATAGGYGIAARWKF